MMNQNSIQVYNTIKDSGMLKGLRFKVFECIHEYGPISMNHALFRLGLKVNNSGRFTELQEMGVIKVTGWVKNASGHPESMYTVTGNLPEKLESTKADYKSKALKAIEKLSKQVNQDDKDELRQIWTAINRMGL